MLLRATRRLAFSISIIIACITLAAAQDAGQVLRVSVGFTTLRNSVAMAEEKRAEVDRLGQMARDANTAGKFAEALKHYYHAMSLMRGMEWTPMRALSFGLTLKL